MLVKPHPLFEAESIFWGTKIIITTRDLCYVRSVVGKESLIKEAFVHEKVEAGERELLVLTRFSGSQPHAAFAGFVHGLMVLTCLARFWTSPKSWIPLRNLCLLSFFPQLWVREPQLQ